MISTATSGSCLLYSLPYLSIQILFIFLMKLILFPLKFVTIPSAIPSSVMPSVLLMGHILLVHHQKESVQPHGTGRGFWPKNVWLHAVLIWDLRMCLVDGRFRQQTRLYFIMPDRLISQFQMGSIILPMLVFPSALSFWSLTEVSVTIWLNGDAQEYGMFPPLITTIYSNSTARPSNPWELFNLCHALAWNVIEHIFGILKWHFHMLLLAPEYDMDIQARVPPALCALHNFIHQHDPSDIEDYLALTPSIMGMDE